MSGNTQNTNTLKGKDLIDHLRTTRTFISPIAQNNYKVLVKQNPEFENYLFNVWLPKLKYDRFTLFRSDYDNDLEANLVNTAYGQFHHVSLNKNTQ